MGPSSFPVERNSHMPGLTAGGDSRPSRRRAGRGDGWPPAGKTVNVAFHTKRHRAQRRAVRELCKHRVQVMHRMADLVDRQGFGLAQFALGVKRFFFKKALDAGGRLQKISACTAPGLVGGGEDGAVAVGIKRIDDLQRTLAQRADLCGGLEAGQHQVAVGLVLKLLLRAEHDLMMPSPSPSPSPSPLPTRSGLCCPSASPADKRPPC